MDVHDELDLSGMSPVRVLWASPLLARWGSVSGSGSLGASCCAAAIVFDANEATGLDGALRRLATETWGLLVVFAVGAGFVAYGISASLPSRTDEAVATAEARRLPSGSPSEWLFDGQRFSGPGASVACREVTEHERRDGHVADESRGEPGVFRRLTRHITAATGSAGAAAVVVGAAAGWLVLGAITDFPRWWELLATVGVPFLTLLMVVLIQHTQNHDDRATQLKLDELIRATHTATNRMMTVEDANRADLDRIHDNFQSQAESAAPEPSAGPRRGACGDHAAVAVS